MTDLIRQLNAFEERLNRLSEQAMAAAGRISELEKANETLSQENQKHQIELKQLRKKQVNPAQSLSKSKEGSKLVKDNLTATVTNAELKQQLDEYISTIDRVMAHLSALS
jgi:chromosome segregation ATPase